MYSKTDSARSQSGAPVAARPQVADQVHPTPRKPSDRPWVNRVPTDFLDARKNPVGHRFGWTLLVLEGYCRSRCYCWVGNAELAAAVGCALRTLEDQLKGMEAAGIICRVHSDPSSRERIGIILLKRANPDLPISGPGADEIAEVTRLMRATIADYRDRRRGQGRLALQEPLEQATIPQKTVDDVHGKPWSEDGACPRKTVDELGEMVKKDDDKTAAAPESSSSFEPSWEEPGESESPQADSEPVAPVEPKPEPLPAEAADLVVKALVVKAESKLGAGELTGTIIAAALAEKHEATAIEQAIEETARAKKEGRIRSSVRGFFKAILRNFRNEGVPPPLVAPMDRTIAEAKTIAAAGGDPARAWAEHLVGVLDGRGWVLRLSDEGDVTPKRKYGAAPDLKSPEIAPILEALKTLKPFVVETLKAKGS